MGQEFRIGLVLAAGVHWGSRKEGRTQTAAAFRPHLTSHLLLSLLLQKIHFAFLFFSSICLIPLAFTTFTHHCILFPFPFPCGWWLGFGGCYLFPCALWWTVEGQEQAGSLWCLVPRCSCPAPYFAFDGNGEAGGRWRGRKERKEGQN